MSQTDVFLKNETPFTLTIEVEVSGHPLAHEKWGNPRTELKPGERDRVLWFSRSSGITNNEEFLFSTRVSAQGQTVLLRQKLKGTALDSHMWHTVADEPWFADRDTHAVRWSAGDHDIAIGFRAVSTAGADDLEYVLSADHSRWMGNLKEVLGPRTLCDLVIPGTHDSGAHEFGPVPVASPDASTAVDILAVVSNVPLLGLVTAGVVKAWAQTQARDFNQQLHDGIRYFDLRVACAGEERFDNMRCVHSIWATQVAALTAAVKEFIKTRPHELIILDFNHFYKMTDGALKVLAEGVCADLGAALVPRAPFLKQVNGVYRLDLSRTLGDIWRAGRQVIVIFDRTAEELQLAPFADIWPASTIKSSDFLEVNKGDDEDDGAAARTKLHAAQKLWLDGAEKVWSELASHGAGQLYVFQGVISPQGSYITANILRTGGVQTRCAGFVTAAHYDGMLKDWAHRRGKGLNITIVDYYHEHHASTGQTYIDVVRSLNKR